MKEWGFNILRFTNDEVENELNKVIEQLDKYLSKSNNTIA